jgi:hypothetical protein
VQRWASGKAEVPARVVSRELSRLAYQAVSRGADRELEQRAATIRELAAQHLPMAAT